MLQTFLYSMNNNLQKFFNFEITSWRTKIRKSQDLLEPRILKNWDFLLKEKKESVFDFSLLGLCYTYKYTVKDWKVFFSKNKY